MCSCGLLPNPDNIVVCVQFSCLIDGHIAQKSLYHVLPLQSVTSFKVATIMSLLFAPVVFHYNCLLECPECL
jgi:hypothetical protein